MQSEDGFSFSKQLPGAAESGHRVSRSCILRLSGAPGYVVPRLDASLLLFDGVFNLLPAERGLWMRILGRRWHLGCTLHYTCCKDGDHGQMFIAANPGHGDR